MTMLYRSTDRRCRRGAPMVNLAHSASFHSQDKIAPSNPGTKHLGLAYELVPGGAAMVEDRLVGWEGAVRKPLVPEELPDGLNQVQY